MSQVTNFDKIAVKKGGKAAQTLAATVAGAQTTGAGKATIFVPKGGKITGLVGYLGTAPTGTTTFKVDVNVNGVTLYTTQGNRLTWTAGQNLSSTTLPDVVDVPDNAVITIDVDAVGSTIAGSDLSVGITLARPFVD